MTPMSPSSRVKLFWAKVVKGEGCWEHSGSLGSHGYPQATDIYASYSVPAQRAALQVHLGRSLRKNEWGLHKCNNKRCVRVHPDHVYVGNHKQNMDDMARVGHSRRGLTPEQADEARAKVSSGELSHRAAAVEYGVSARAIYNLVHNITYRYTK